MQETVENLKLNGMCAQQIILVITTTPEDTEDFVENSLQSDKAL